MESDLISRISGRRKTRNESNLYPSPDSTMKVLVMEQKPIVNSRGDMSVQNVPMYYPLSHRLVKDVACSEFTISHIMKTGQIPNVVPTTGALDTVESLHEASQYAQVIENDLQSAVVSESKSE